VCNSQDFCLVATTGNVCDKQECIGMQQQEYTGMQQPGIDGCIKTKNTWVCNTQEFTGFEQSGISILVCNNNEYMSLQQTGIYGYTATGTQPGIFQRVTIRYKWLCNHQEDKSLQ
jgi:hypothetical protein